MMKDPAGPNKCGQDSGSPQLWRAKFKGQVWGKWDALDFKLHMNTICYSINLFREVHHAKGKKRF